MALPIGSAKAKLFQLGESFLHAEFSVAIDARVRNGFVERDFRRPLRNRIVAFAAFVEADLHGLDLVEHFGRALDEQIRQAWRRAGIDQRGAVFLFEALGERELLRLEGIARQVRTQVDIVRAQAQRGAHHNLIEDRSPTR